MMAGQRDRAQAAVSSPHFSLERLAEGVYAAVAKPDGAAFSNAGILDLGGTTLVFDTFDTPQAAEDLRAAAESLTRRSAALVAISHWHGDHWSGNQAFPGARIVATHQAAGRMPGLLEEVRALQSDPSEIREMIRAQEERFRCEADERWRAALPRMIARLRWALEALPVADLRLPDLTFEGTLHFRGAHRSARLVGVGHAHSPGDAYLELPGEGITFLGDLGFFDCQPYIGDCDPAAWGRILDMLQQEEHQILVPGHGRLGTKADLVRQRAYLDAMQEQVAALVARGGSLEDALALPLPPQFTGWSANVARYENNVRFLYARRAPE